MKKIVIIITATIITSLNINSYGKFDSSVIEAAKLNLEFQNTDDFLGKSVNFGFGFTFFKIIHFAELMFVSEVRRRKN